MEKTTLLDFLAPRGKRAELAAHINVSADYLWQVAHGWNGRKPSHWLAQEIERGTRELGGPVVTKETLRPDIWKKAA